ncbi:MAG: MSMEG_4193 family putative phosphomutase [Actinomycetota bacterium]
MILLLVRHAVTSLTGKKLIGWTPGMSLSPQGRKQAEDVANRLAAVPVKAIYTSPLERCAETADAIAGRHRLKPKPMEGLGEIRYGQWQGKSLKTLYRTKAWTQLRAQPADFRFPDGETVREAQTRAIGAIEQLRKKHRGSDAVVVCSHADVIRLAVAGYIGLGIDLYSRISIAPASVTVLSLGDTPPRLLRLGDLGGYDGMFGSDEAGKRVR